MYGENIEVTRWDNDSQGFVIVGNLVKVERADREYPIIGFQYDNDYLSKYSYLAPFGLEPIHAENVVIGDTRHNDFIPSYFKQFLPDDATKHYINKINRESLSYDSFDLLKYVTSVKGSFKAIQLNHDASKQSNMALPVVHACKQLISFQDSNQEIEDLELLSSIYNVEQHIPSINAMVNVDGELYHCILQLHENEVEPKKLKTVREIFSNAGVDTPVIFTAETDGKYFTGHINGVEKHSAAIEKSQIFNEIPIACLLEASKRTTSFEKDTFAKIADVIAAHSSNTAKESILKIALLSNLLLQKHLSPHNIFLREVAPGEWNIAPLKISPPQLDPKVMPTIAMNDAHSSLLQLSFDEHTTRSISKSFKLNEDKVNRTIINLSEQLKNYSRVAEKYGLQTKDIEIELEHISKSNLAEYANQLTTGRFKEMKPE